MPHGKWKIGAKVSGVVHARYIYENYANSTLPIFGTLSNAIEYGMLEFKL